MAHHHTHSPSLGQQRGFTLVELMVGLALGLITTLIIAQVMINADAQQRTTTQGTDAQINGASAVYLLSRDLQAAGYGLISKAADLGCPIRAVQPDGQALDLTLAPVLIGTDANGNATIRTLSSGKAAFAVPVRVQNQYSAGETSFVVPSSLGVVAGDLLLVAPDAWDADNWCALMQANSAGSNTLTSTRVPVITGGWTPDTAANQQGAAGRAWMPTGTPAYKVNSTLINLGQLPDLREYRVNNNALEMRRMGATGAWDAWAVMTPGVVRLLALYGMDTSMPEDNVVDTYTSTAPNSAGDWGRVKTLKLVVITRSAQRERLDPVTKQPVTTAQPVIDLGESALQVQGAAPCAYDSDRRCLTVSLGELPAASEEEGGEEGENTPPAPPEWQNYRYKVFDTVVPLRNHLWRP
ncbi:prepilin-type N-terminal cleavage/methylation domain-containing protein [Aquabacterium fontiphilum]|jgi:type IV pilus assembly protein PilW|uniref:PilW family protein n=1 Tax=Aquabacterium fontiphilum TaxID=450365 RepID=UPI001376FA92|nr:PilW family protein [Aquabacterium fontiphilum]NBD21110.1 prepilin-type N-terminal cleavage/methylation domain-containing protein [Aquabacterium fontiphilum]